MRALKVLFPVVTGAVCAGLDAALGARTEPYTEDVTVVPKLPPEGERTARMVTVRFDGGPQDGPLQSNGFGFNVWAETSVNAEKLARMCMGVLPAIANGAPVVRVAGFTGPFEITDETTDLLTVDGVTLSHFYFACQVTSRGTDL